MNGTRRTSNPRFDALLCRKHGKRDTDNLRASGSRVQEGYWCVRVGYVERFSVYYCSHADSLIAMNARHAGTSSGVTSIISDPTDQLARTSPPGNVKDTRTGST